MYIVNVKIAKKADEQRIIRVPVTLLSINVYVSLGNKYYVRKRVFRFHVDRHKNVCVRYFAPFLGSLRSFHDILTERVRQPNCLVKLPPMYSSNFYT